MLLPGSNVVPPASYAPAPARAPAAFARSPGRPTVTLTAVDPGSSFGLEVGDTLTFTAVIRLPDHRRPVGTVTFSSDNRYEPGCRHVALGRTARAVCYLTFYSPGRFYVTAAYRGDAGGRVSVTLRFTVVPSTDD